MIKKIVVSLIFVSILVFGLTGCGKIDLNQNSQNNSSVSNSSEKRTAKNTLRDGESIQTEDNNKATRVIAGGTIIKMTFGDTVIYGILNDSETAKALIAKLPMEQHVSRYSHDFCGVTEDLPYNKEEEHYGWLNGDIDYATDAPYFTILFEDEDVSEQYGSQVNIGVITSPISDISKLQGSYDVKIELDK